ncbi:hypothetical protein LUZ61_005727 [Rhynchospora tenuis]|uniref:glutathione transferase n=1 Tax=Rhynchospora tenuis TaxID=198213 RepID=A0AAD5ZQ81_9POAL|nr:hypothetical protein LUZ61_005727 [Rhynchospora tenuis]
MGVMKVYGVARYMSVARVIVCLEEVGADYQVVPVDFAVGEHKTPAHLARNPFGLIPAFEDDDLVIFESRTISKYVLRKYKSSDTDDLLRENNLTESTLVDQWLDVEAHHYDPLVFHISYNAFVLPKIGGTGDQKLIDTNLEKLKKVLEVYEAQLSKTKYLAGNFISLADLSHFPATYYFMATPYANLFDNYPHVKAWWENLMTRPSLKKAAAGMFPVA